MATSPLHAPKPPTDTDAASAHIAEPPRRRWLLPSFIGFVAGVAVSQAFGFWTFLSALVHGLPLPEANLTTALSKTLNPTGYERVAARWESNVDGSSAKRCIDLIRPVSGGPIETVNCPDLHFADLKRIPGVAPRNHRLALSAPLLSTTTPQRKAPVAGWAARIGDGTSPKAGQSAQASDGDTNTPASNQEPNLSSGWATTATSDN